MNATLIWPVLAVIAGGMAVALQVPINAVLGRASGSFVLAAAISFGVGTVALFALYAVRSGSPGIAGTLSVPWWAWTGGLLGAYFVWANVSSVGTLGVVTVFAGVVLGQMVMALLLDSIGAFGVPIQPISWTRVGAILLVVSGLVLSRL